jgi:hypothetical protein
MLFEIRYQNICKDTYNERFVSVYEQYDNINYFQNCDMYSVKQEIVNTCEICKDKTKNEKICYFCNLNETITPTENKN